MKNLIYLINCTKPVNHWDVKLFSNQEDMDVEFYLLHQAKKNAILDGIFK